MLRRLAVLILLGAMSLIQTAEIPHQISLSEVEVGGNVTLECQVSKTDYKYFYWYKQPLGYMVQRVVAGIAGKLTISNEFNNSRFTVTKRDTQNFLTITNISKEDEAAYFCLYGGAYLDHLNGGIFLAVNDRNQQKSLYVKQSPKTELVHPGDSVTLQCSLLSKTKGNTDQCPGERSVYWFRSGSGQSYPGIIYTHSDKEEERSCVYSLSKTIQNSSDTGTYYCVVVTCGEILFGEGTKVETSTRGVCDSGAELDPVVLVLGVLLACCLTVIAARTFYGNRKKVCERCKEALSACHHRGNDRSTVDQSNYLDGEERAMNYTALDFLPTKVTRRKRESSPECVYSVADYHNQHQPSL